MKAWHTWHAWHCPNPDCLDRGKTVFRPGGGMDLKCPRCQSFLIGESMKPTDPNVRLARKMKQAYRSTGQYQVDRLMAAQTRWLRKQTIATNKLAGVRKEIDQLLATLAAPKTP